MTESATIELYLKNKIRKFAVAYYLNIRWT